jgi:hypothetical protein
MMWFDLVCELAALSDPPPAQLRPTGEIGQGRGFWVRRLSSHSITRVLENLTKAPIINVGIPSSLSLEIWRSEQPRNFAMSLVVHKRVGSWLGGDEWWVMPLLAVSTRWGEIQSTGQFVRCAAKKETIPTQVVDFSARGLEFVISCECILDK